MKRILLIEDDKEISKIIRSYLEKNDYEVLSAKNGKTGIDIFQNESTIDLILLDIMLPDLDGWSVCRKIRQVSSVPIIILTARDDEDDELYGFELKANDYVRKPFSPKILLARVGALVNTDTSEVTLAAPNIVEKGMLSLNKATYEVRVEGEQVEMTKKEFHLLFLLASNEKIVFSRDQILNEIWSFEYNTESRIVDNHIKNIRKALGDYAYYISTIFGIGYKFEVK